jgi:hypothetical protein
MDKVIFEKIYTAVAGIVVSLVVGYAVRKVWTAATGSEPPTIDDPDVPTKRALSWFVISTVTLGVASHLTKRAATRVAEYGIKRAEAKAALG